MYVLLSFRSVTSSVCYFLFILSISFAPYLFFNPSIFVSVFCHRRRGCRRRHWMGPNEITTTFITLSSDALRTISIGFLGICLYIYIHNFLLLLTISESNGSVNRRQSNIKKCLRELTTNFLTPFYLMYRVASFHIKSMSFPLTFELGKERLFETTTALATEAAAAAAITTANTVATAAAVYRIMAQMCHNFSVFFRSAATQIKRLWIKRHQVRKLQKRDE